MGFWNVLGGIGQEATGITGGQELALQRAQQRQQMLESAMRTALEQRRVGLEEQRLKMQQQPQFLGSYEQAGGRYGIIQHPDGTITTQTLSAAQVPDQLTDPNIDAFVATLPQGEDKEGIKRVIKGYRDLGQPDKAFAAMTGAIKPRTPHIIRGWTQDKSSTTGFSQVTYDAITGEIYQTQPNLIYQPGLPVVTTQTDNAGVTTVNVRTPQLPAAGAPVPPQARRPAPLQRVSSAAPTAPLQRVPSAAVPPLRTPAPSPQVPFWRQPLTDVPPPEYGLAVPPRTAAAAPAAQVAAARPSTPRGQASLMQYGLDANGLIPPGVANENLRAGANFLLAGGDVTKLPAEGKDKLAIQALAARYGWSQGKFTPKEQVMLQESTTILREFRNSPTLSALDDGLPNRLAMARSIESSKNQNLFGQAITGIASTALSDNAQNFILLYNQAVGRISGLSQLTRTGRPTEATIERLMSELPNPLKTPSSDLARRKIDKLLEEVDIALQRGGGPGTWDPPQAQGTPSPAGGSKYDEELKKYGLNP